MQIKDYMLFQAHIYRTQNARMLELLKAQPAALLTEESPILANGTIVKNLDAMISNGAFTINALALGCIDKAEFTAKYVDGEIETPHGKMAHIRSYAEAGLEELGAAMMDIAARYEAIYAACDEEELTVQEGLPPYDFATKSLCLAYQLRGEIVAFLRGKGAELGTEGLFNGGLVD